MKTFPSLVILALTLHCGCFTTQVKPRDDAFTGHVNTSAFGWTSTVPVKNLKKVKGLFHEGIGMIDNADDFDTFWNIFTLNQPIIRPGIDFSNFIVIMVYSPEYYNICRIIGVDVNKGLALPIISSTRTKLKVQETVYMSVVPIPREGVLAVISGDRTLKVSAVKKP